MSDRPQFPRTERDEAPLYLARYLERQAKAREPEPEDEDTPLYLRRFRQRRESQTITDQLPPLYQRVGHGMQQALSEDNRNKEISAPPAARPQVANEVYLVRHGETQGYSTESGLTPLGAWQAHTYGHTLAKRVKSGETVVVRHAATNRAGQTAESIHRGLLDGLASSRRTSRSSSPGPWTSSATSPSRPPTACATSPPPSAGTTRCSRSSSAPPSATGPCGWWRSTGSGGPSRGAPTRSSTGSRSRCSTSSRRPCACGASGRASCAWRREHPGARLAIATHSGPIRAFAITAFGYDPGEPYNTEHVRIKLMEGHREALVSYRNRVQEIHVPDIEHLPTWQLDEQWAPR
jgi:hypothetical protein